jgi:2-desacetyl-2-hydroxyethyl bacteriochlorophyllide A dehydrogenase
MQAHAVVATAAGRVEYQSVTVPEPGPEEVVIRITHSWISNGTEGSFVRGERIAGDTPRADTDPLPFPHVPGYQKVGVVEWVGRDVSNLRVGETVFAAMSHVDGMFYGDGGHVSPAVTHRSQIWKLPPGLDPVAASGLVLTQVGYNVGIRPQVSIGDAAIVLGDGMVGHWAAQTLQFRGARVLMAGKHDERLAKWEMRPGDRIVNITRENLLDVAK